MAPSDRSDRAGTPRDSRNRSRSPRRERGGRRAEPRYRSRSPYRRREPDRDRDDRRDDRGDRPRNDGRGREPYRAPRGSEGGTNFRDRKSDLKTSGPVKAPSAPIASKKTPEPVVDVKMTDDDRPEGMDDETWEMNKIMGFSGFKSTKNTKVPGNDKNFAISKEKKMEARQYMNRQGGFNRPLSPTRQQ